MSFLGNMIVRVSFECTATLDQNPQSVRLIRIGTINFLESPTLLFCGYNDVSKFSWKKLSSYLEI